MMTEKTATSPRTKYSFRSARSTTSSQSEEDVIQMNVIYKDREYSVKIPDQADRMTICNEIKRQTGVKGAFYLYNGTKSYLHSSSLTLSNISKVCGGRLEIRGGDWINKGGDSIWYYYSQTLRPDVQQKIHKRQCVPFDCPP